MATALASTKAVNHKKKVGVSLALLVSVVDFVHFVFLCRGIALAVEQGALLTRQPTGGGKVSCKERGIELGGQP